MEWHSGNMLAHTVFTLAYIFHLPEIETGSMIPAFLSECDPKRPIELITGVLGPCVEGLLKCVDLAGRELHNNESIQDVSYLYSPSAILSESPCVDSRKTGRVTDAKSRLWKTFLRLSCLIG